MTIQENQYLNLPNGIRIHYASAGQPTKPLMLFVHGFPEFWYAWSAILDNFSDNYYAVAIDLRGFNLSSKPVDVEAYAAKRIVEDLTHIIHELGYEQAVLVSHDWGGAIAWNLAIHFPNYVTKLVSINSPHPIVFAQALMTDPEQQAASAYMNWLCQSGSEQALVKNNFQMLEQMISAGGEQPATWLQGVTRDRYHQAWSVLGEQDSDAMTGAVNYYRASPLRPTRGGSQLPLPSPDVMQQFIVRVPTLVIWGEQDRALRMGLLLDLPKWVECLHIERISLGTHWVVHEYPEKVTELIRQYVAQ